MIKRISRFRLSMLAVLGFIFLFSSFTIDSTVNSSRMLLFIKQYINGLMMELLLMETNLSFVEKEKVDGMKHVASLIKENPFEKEIKGFTNV